MIMFVMQQSIDDIEVDGSLFLAVCDMDDLIMIYDGGLVTTINGDFENARWVFKNGKLKSKCKDVNVKIDISNKCKDINISCGMLRDSNFTGGTISAGTIKNCKFDNCVINVNTGTIDNCEFINTEVTISDVVVTKTKFVNCKGFVNMQYDDSVVFDDCDELRFGGLIID
jgi:hypothetical protein